MMDKDLLVMMLKQALEQIGIDWKNKDAVKDKLIQDKLAEGKCESEAKAFADFFLNVLYGSEEESLNQYKEILRLREMLDAADIPYDFGKGNMGGYHLQYAPANSQNVICSVIQSATSYGGKEDLLEIQGLVTEEEKQKNRNTVLGFLTAENVFERISEHYKMFKKGEMVFHELLGPIVMLKEMLEKVNIPFEFKLRVGGAQILYHQPKTNHRVSVICTMTSYGRDEGKVEIMSNDYDAMPIDVREAFQYICALENGDL